MIGERARARTPSADLVGLFVNDTSRGNRTVGSGTPILFSANSYAITITVGHEQVEGRSIYNILIILISYYRGW